MKWKRLEWLHFTKNIITTTTSYFFQLQINKLIWDTKSILLNFHFKFLAKNVKTKFEWYFSCFAITKIAKLLRSIILSLCLRFSIIHVGIRPMFHGWHFYLIIHYYLKMMMWQLCVTLAASQSPTQSKRLCSRATIFFNFFLTPPSPSSLLLVLLILVLSVFYLIIFLHLPPLACLFFSRVRSTGGILNSQFHLRAKHLIQTYFRLLEMC